MVAAFGWEEPVFVHLSVFLKPRGKGKMSKRDSAQLMKDGFSIFISDLRTLGYLPEAVVNWTALMGWSYDSHTEFFCLDDLVEKFNIDRLNPSPAAINTSKLDHFNGLHIRDLEVPDLAARIMPFMVNAGYEVEDEKLLKVTPLIQQRIVTLDDAPEMGGFFFEEDVEHVPEDLVGKNMTPAESANALKQAYLVLADLPEITPETAEEPMRALAEQLGLKAGQLFSLLREAVTGRKVSPPLFETMAVIGKEKVLERISQAEVILQAMEG